MKIDAGAAEVGARAGSLLASAASIVASRRDAERALALGDVALLDAILDHSPHGVIVCDAKGELILHNKAAVRIWAGEAAALHLADWGQYRAFHPDGRPYAPTDWAMARCLSDQRVVEAEEVQIQRFDGTRGVLLGSCAPILGDAGDVRGAISVFADITQLKAVERALAEREDEVRRVRDKLDAILANMADGVTVQEPSGKLRYANLPAARMTGFATVEELLGTPIADVDRRFELYDEDGQPFASERLPGRRVLTGEPHAEEVIKFRLLATDEERVALVKATPILNDDGDVRLTINLFRDITERWRAERAAKVLAQASAALSASLDYQATLKAVARLCVPLMADWCVVELADDEGRPRETVAIEHIDPDKLALAVEYRRRFKPRADAPHGAAQVMRTGISELHRVISTDDILRNISDPDQRRVLMSLGLKSSLIVPITARNKVLGAMILVSDRPGRHYSRADVEIGEELGRRAGIAIDNARLYETARTAANAREDLLAIVSHDLRNPLSNALMRIELLSKHLSGDAGGARVERDVQAVRRALERMRHLIDDLQDADFVESGSLTLKCERQPIGVIVRLAVEAIRPLADHKLIRVIGESAAESRAVVSCDRERLLQVFSNLLGNAVKFTPEGGVIRVVVDEEPGAVRCQIVDTGAGIAPEHLPHVFERYWQAQRRSAGGLGLGLYITRALVEAHGGSIGVGSSLGAGSTFHFTLPRVDG